MQTLQLESPLDMHVHLREPETLAQLVPHTAESFAGAVVMPNLNEAVDSPQRVQSYKAAIKAAAGSLPFEPYMTAFFRPMSRAALAELAKHTIALKLYPQGSTTNSEGGLRELKAGAESFEHMQSLGMRLMVHGESGGFVMDREAEFLDAYRWLAESFPQLKIVMEHITTAAALQLLSDYENISATVTVHHLLLTLDEVLGEKLSPHLFCKPIIKRPEDRAALQAAVFASHPKIALGTDSAPHTEADKLSPQAPAGIFSAPIALALLAELFEANGVLEKLPFFVSGAARAIYGVNPSQKTVRLIREPWCVPQRYGNFVPLYAGKSLSWKLDCEPPQTAG